MVVALYILRMTSLRSTCRGTGARTSLKTPQTIQHEPKKDQKNICLSIPRPVQRVHLHKGRNDELVYQLICLLKNYAGPNSSTSCNHKLAGIASGILRPRLELRRASTRNTGLLCPCHDQFGMWQIVFGAERMILIVYVQEQALHILCSIIKALG